MKTLEELFRNEAKDVFGFPGKKIITDPDSEEYKWIYYNPVPKKALVDELTTEKISWKMPGKKVVGAIVLIIETDDLDDFKSFGKIEYDDVEYFGYTDDGNQFEIQKMKDGNYVKLTLWRIK